MADNAEDGDNGHNPNCQKMYGELNSTDKSFIKICAVIFINLCSFIITIGIVIRNNNMNHIIISIIIRIAIRRIISIMIRIIRIVIRTIIRIITIAP